MYCRELQLLKKVQRCQNLFFADDIISFRRAKRFDCSEVIKILTLCRQASRHEVNVNKFGILFSKSTSVDDANMAKEVLEINRLMDKDHYLGLLIFLGSFLF